MKKLFIISGEASGDLHGSNLIKALKQNAEIEIQAWGGDLMEAAGAKVLKHYKELAFMGFWEVISNIRTISKNFKLCKEQILDFKPDAVVFIDYPGFNLRMAKFCKEHGIKTLYYISPQVWAWKQNRVKKIKAFVDKMYVILPFEKEFYDQFNYEVDFVGHPLIDAIEDFKNRAKPADVFRATNGLDDRPVIALLPGSRNQEIKVKLPLMLSVVKEFKDYQFVIAGAPSKDKAFYQEFLGEGNVALVENDTYNLLNNSFAALVTSGTATLETALFKVPQVVCYKGSSISYHIAKRVIKVKYISLVNLIQDEEVVTELIQGELTTPNIKTELIKITSGKKREKMLTNYDELIKNCGGVGASAHTAQLIINEIS
ncbi:lipid-A-disaccharide synthase [Parvicella tangerina]|uniref:Lipid-A-disaccharide synthase n=1 Tax=Parvicella tangerina TaxID=2829795 RepID=A0A916JN29_9FLAO|nr:lipid-A-disaccharide synthase [Parvicella tangerina]CAG5083953.1 Lipid-A-disaccharide synthase [Parvicella tangerina]